MNDQRKGFNFLRSYYDVMLEIPNDKDKLDFLVGIIEKQFNGIEPQLTGMSRFAYVSQKHQIDKSRQGWEDKVGYQPRPTEGSPVGSSGGGTEGPTEGGTEGPTEGNTENVDECDVFADLDPTEGPSEGSWVYPSVQEQEKEQEKVKEKEKAQVQEEVREQEKAIAEIDKLFYKEYKKDIEFIITQNNCSLVNAIAIHKEFLHSLT